jgi:hypothetical protein
VHTQGHSIKRQFVHLHLCVVSRYNFPITTGNALEQRRNVCMAGPAPGLSDILPALDLSTVYLENRFWHFE